MKRKGIALFLAWALTMGGIGTSAVHALDVEIGMQPQTEVLEMAETAAEAEETVTVDEETLNTESSEDVEESIVESNGEEAETNVETEGVITETEFQTETEKNVETVESSSEILKDEEEENQLLYESEKLGMAISVGINETKTLTIYEPITAPTVGFRSTDFKATCTYSSELDHDTFQWVYTLEVTGKFVGTTTIEKYNMSTNQVYDTYTVEVYPHNTKMCIGEKKNITVKTAEGGGFSVSCRPESGYSCVFKGYTTTTIGSVTTYGYNYEISFSSVGEYVLSFKHNATGDVTIYDALVEEHGWNTSIEREPTCSQEGVEKVTCDRCGVSYSNTIEKLPHIWRTDYTVDREATCLEAGQKSIHCENCSSVKEGSIQDIPMLEHKWNTELTVDRESTCTEDGFKSIHCGLCGSIKEGSVVTIKAPGHESGEWKVIQEATTEEEGLKIRKCEVCHQEIERQSIPKIQKYLITYNANGGKLGIDTPNGEIVNEYGEPKIENIPYEISRIDIEKSYVVIYDGDGGTPNEMRCETINLFAGWNTKPDGSGKWYLPGEVYRDNKELTLYAQWKDAYFDDALIVEKKGCIFEGWYSAQTGGKKVTNTTKLTGDMKVYARWIPVRFSLSDTNLVIGVGETAKVNAVFSPEGYDNKGVVEWFSDFGDIHNQEIVNIKDYGWNELTIVGAREGEVNIYADSKNSGIILGEGAPNKLKCKVVVKGFAYRLYETLLNRKPDPSGWQDWVNLLNAGTITGADAAEGFIFSDELKKQNLSNDEFVERMYMTFLNRHSDPSGRAAWVKQLDNGMSRRGIFKGFAESAEFSKLCNSYGIVPGEVTLSEPREMNAGVTMFVSRCYDKALGRKADVEGLNGWCHQLLTKTETAKKVAHGFIFSQEVLSKNLSDEEYIRVLYRVFMDREADGGGLVAWEKVLKDGKGREHVFNGFADSPEFREICARYGIE